MIGEKCIWHAEDWNNLLGQEMDKTSGLLVRCCEDKGPLAQEVLEDNSVPIPTLGER